MSKKLQLTIPKPCHENWDAMTPVQQGKFCGSCEKQVVDFSDMSDRQVAEFFKKPSTGSVCGRFMSDQLDRSIEIPKKRIPWVKYFFQFVIPAFLVSIKASAQKTQGTVAITKMARDTTKIPKNPVLMGKVAAPVYTTPLMGAVAYIPEKVIKLSGTIQLKVVDEKGSAIPYASIETGVIGKGGAANKNGLFNLDKSILNINGKIFVSSAGYERKEVLVKTISGVAGTFTIELKIKGWLDEVVVTAFGIKRCPMTLGAVSRVEGSQLTAKNLINGKVIDEKGNPLFDASVVIKGTSNGVTTNAKGSFSIKPGTDLKDIRLVASYVGFETIEQLLGEKAYSDTVIIQLRPLREMLVGELVVCRKPPTKKELKKVPLIPAIVDHAIAFKVFPNPVVSGSSLNIEIKKMEEGYYDLQLLNQSGQLLQQQETWIDEESRLLSIDIPPVAAGSYFFTMTNKKSGKKFTEKVIIQ